jgi:HlyD family secretion protein
MPRSFRPSRFFAAPSRRRVVLAVAVAGALALFAALWLPRRAEPSVSPTQAAGPVREIVARGRLEPADRVHRVDGPSGGGTVVELRVAEGSRVKAGDVLAVLDTNEIREAEVELAQRELVVAELEREQVMAGAKQSEIRAQQALTQARQAQLVHARRQLERSRGLVGIGATTHTELEQNEMDLLVAERQLEQATASTAALTEVRPVDAQVAQARIEQARASLVQARAELERTVVRAPVDGTVLSLSTRTGARLDQNGLLTLGDVDHPVAVAEFDETDALSVRPGSVATVRMRGSEATYAGRVERVYSQVFLNERPTTDVLKGRDARIVEAEIRFDEGQQVPPIAGLEVIVSVPLSGAGGK